MTRLTPFAMLIAVAALASEPAAAQTKKLPTTAEVLAKLKQKRERGGVQRIKLEFEYPVFKDRKQVGTCPAVEELLIDWRTGKFHSVGWDANAVQPFEQITAYDGEKVKTQFRSVTKQGKPIGNGAWTYGMVTGGPQLGAYQPEWWPVFFHKGVIAGLRDHFYWEHLVFDPDAEEFFVDGEVTKDGRKCISLKTRHEFGGNPIQSNHYEYILDPGKDHSVVELIYYRNDKPFFSLDITVGDVRQDGSWPVGGWTYTSFDSLGRAELVIKAKVSDFKHNLRLDETNPFDLVPPEGATVLRSHYMRVRDRNGKWDRERIPFKYEVKNGKLIQIEGPPQTPEWWVTDHWRSIARQVIMPAVLLAVPRRTVLRNSPGYN